MLWFKKQGEMEKKMNLEKFTIKTQQALSNAQQQVIEYGQQQLLPEHVLRALLEDSDGILWLSTNQGLSRFDPEDGTIINYDSNDGLQGNEFNGNAFFKNRKGEMFGRKRFLNIIRKSANFAAEDIQTAIIDAATSFQGKTQQDDDITLLILKFM